MPALSIFYTAAQVNGRRFLSYQVAGSDPKAPVFPQCRRLTDTALIVKPNINAFAPGYKNTYQIQANLQVQREMARNVIVTRSAITTPRSVTACTRRTSTWERR